MNTFIAHIWDSLKAFFTKAQAAIITFAAPGLHMLVDQGGDILAQAAQSAVTAAESNGGTAGEKFTFAKNALITNVKAQIPNLTENAINLALELAVAVLKHA